MSHFDRSVLDTIHTHSLEILKDIGIRFPSDEAIATFKDHGFQVHGSTVYFAEKDIHQALKTAPRTFTIESRNPEKGILVGENNYIVVPGYGPPFIIEPSGEKRGAVMADVVKFCKLVQTSKHLDMNSAIVVQPNDVPSETAHLDLLLATLTLTDKPIMGSSASGAAAQDSLNLAQRVWGHTHRPVMLSLINSLSPLQYAGDMLEALMVFARAGQPVIIHSACSLGLTGPITIAGSLVVSNATTLAGICLSQLINPGTPVVYGLGGSAVDMQSGAYMNASHEDMKHTAISSAMARYYGLPCRGQGALTESFCLDYQAGMESAMMLAIGSLSGVNVSIHACGTYGSMLAMSLEKFIADEDLCGAVKQVIQPLDWTEEAFALNIIKEMGATGNYLMADHTVERCRSEFLTSDLRIHCTHDKWLAMEPREITLRAGRILEKRLAAYTKPDMDPKLERDLIRYVNEKKSERRMA
jgi:trimethylamine--corrinoid protein Co-methyltransferase